MRYEIEIPKTLPPLIQRKMAEWQSVYNNPVDLAPQTLEIVNLTEDDEFLWQHRVSLQTFEDAQRRAWILNDEFHISRGREKVLPYDVYAAAAVRTMLNNEIYTGFTPYNLAKFAHDIAEEMVIERNKRISKYFAS